jgi:hypothetical protein
MSNENEKTITKTIADITRSGASDKHMGELGFVRGEKQIAALTEIFPRIQGSEETGYSTPSEETLNLEGLTEHELDSAVAGFGISVRLLTSYITKFSSMNDHTVPDNSDGFWENEDELDNEYELMVLNELKKMKIKYIGAMMVDTGFYNEFPVWKSEDSDIYFAVQFITNCSAMHVKTIQPFRMVNGKPDTTGLNAIIMGELGMPLISSTGGIVTHNMRALINLLSELSGHNDFGTFTNANEENMFFDSVRYTAKIKAMDKRK